MPATATHAPERHRPFRRLETPQVLLLSLLLIVVDVVTAVVQNVLAHGVGCASVSCQNQKAASTGAATATLVIAVVVVVVPIAVALLKRVGVRTVLVVQLIGGALLVLHASGFISTAHQAKVHPPPPVTTLVTIPCVEKTLSDHVCVSQPPISTAAPGG